jgi:hypothetical protein
MKALKLNRRMVLVARIVGVVLLAAILVFFLMTLLSNNKEKENIAQATQESLQKGACNDPELEDLRDARNSTKGSETEQQMLRDLAVCYEFRQDLQRAKDTYEELASLQEKAGQANELANTRQAIENMQYLIDFKNNPGSSEDPEGVGAN